MAIERTLTIIKPDAVNNKHAGDIIRIFEANHFTLLAARMVNLSKRQAQGFYHVHRSRPFFESLTSFMSSGPSLVAVLQGDSAIARLREIMGATDPAKAEPGTIRKLFATGIEHNAIHGSDSAETAAYEISYFFPGIDLA
jgi:nucleoside-diphosphate kinase